jgi:hypothetical protein
MKSRLLLLGMIAGLASATPLTLTFIGTADVSLGDVSLTQANFSLVFTSDTSLLVTPSNIPVDTSTPSGTPGTFTIAGIGSGVFTDNQAVFEHPSPESDIGVWHFNDTNGDWLAKQDPAFAAYTLTTSLGPITTGNNAAPLAPMSTSLGDLQFSNVSALSFQAVVTGGTSATPEPSTGLLLSLGIGGILLGTRFRRNASSKN